MLNNKHTYLLMILLGINWVSLKGQVADNPFDLKHRQNTEISVPNDSIQQEKNSIDSTMLPNNPFDIVLDASPAKVDSPKEAKDKAAKKQPQKQGDLGFLFWVFLTIVLLFSSVYGVAKDRIQQLYNSFINENFLRQLYRQTQGNFSIIYLILYLFAFVNIGIFGFHCLKYWVPNCPQHLVFLLQLVGITALMLLGKHLLLFFVGTIFPLSKEISLYNFTLMTFWILIGIFLIPINILITYAPALVSDYTLLGAVGLILATLAYRAIRGISIGSKYLFSYKFHFFIYLCTIEVLPFIVLLKFFKNYTEATLL